MIIANRKRASATVAMIVLAFALVHVGSWLLPSIFEPWNARAVDRLFIFRANAERFRPKYDERVILVDLDDAAIRALRNFYLDRSHFAAVVRNLAAAGVAAQIYDFIFAAPSTVDQDAALVDAVSAAGRAYFGVTFRLDRRQRPRGSRTVPPDERRVLDAARWPVRVVARDPTPEGHTPLTTFPVLAAQSAGLGFMNVTPDRDGVFRRVPLLIRTEGGYVPSLGFRAVCDYLGVLPSNIVLDPGRSVTLRGARATSSAASHDIVIPTDREGNLILDFVGSWEAFTHKGFEVVAQAAEDRDRMEILREELNGRIVLIADTSTGVADVGPVPTDAQFPLAGIHATVVNSILTESFLREGSVGRMLMMEAVLLFALSLMATRFAAWQLPAGTVALAAMWVGMWAWSFLSMRIILDVVGPLLMIGSATTAVSAYRYIVEQRDRAVLRRSFEAYFPPAVVERIVRNPDAITQAGQKKELTILFSDIKDFTSRSATMQPEAVRMLLNEYFGAMVEIVFRHGGTVDKFIGDGLMVFFGDPEDQPDHAQRAVDCAIAMQKKVCALNAAWTAQGRQTVKIRIGIHTGVVIVGNMGSGRRLSYTAIGAAVNLAQRLESNAPVGGILLSEVTYGRVDRRLTVASERIAVKGLSETVTVYAVSAENVLA